MVQTVQDGELVGLELGFRTPPSLHLVIEREGSVVVDRSVSGIRYNKSYPNGEDCDDDACLNANVQL